METKKQSKEAILKTLKESATIGLVVNKPRNTFEVIEFREFLERYKHNELLEMCIKKNTIEEITTIALEITSNSEKGKKKTVLFSKEFETMELAENEYYNRLETLYNCDNEQSKGVFYENMFAIYDIENNFYDNDLDLTIEIV